MTDPAKLVERLESYYVIVGGKPWFSNKTKVHRAIDIHEAAQLIREQSSLITELREALKSKEEPALSPPVCDYCGHPHRPDYECAHKRARTQNPEPNNG